MERQAIKVKINGKAYELSVPPWRTLLEVIREDLKLTGTKEPSSSARIG